MPLFSDAVTVVLAIVIVVEDKGSEGSKVSVTKSPNTAIDE